MYLLNSNEIATPHGFHAAVRDLLSVSGTGQAFVRRRTPLRHWTTCGQVLRGASICIEKRVKQFF